jgi:hypothetical protein
VRPLTRATAIDYRGRRSILGRTVDRYAIWDPTVGGQPIREFPLTSQGWVAAWDTFRTLEAAVGGPGAIPPLGLGRLLALSFSVYGRNLWVLAVIGGLVIVPYYAFSVALILATVRLTPERVGLETVITPDIPLWVDVLNNVLLYAFVVPLLTAAVVTAVIAVMLGRRPSVRSAYRRAVRRAPSILGASFLAALAVVMPVLPGILVGANAEGSSPAVGLAVALITLGLMTGVFLALRFVFASTVVVVEGAGGVEALRRSWWLVRGLTGKVLGGLAVVLLIVFGVLVVALTVALTAALFGDLTESTVRLVLIVVGAVSAFSLSLLAPLVNVLIVLLYLDARGRKEGLTLGSLGSSLEG